MKKKISILLCLLAALAVLAGGCTKARSETQFDRDSLEQLSDAIITQIMANVSEESLAQVEKLEDFSLQSQLYQMGYPMTPKSYVESAEAWLQGLEECGTYVSHGDYRAEATKDQIVLTTEAEFAERQATISFTYNERSYLESMSVSADYSTGEILEKAGLNTLLGMGTVFAVLIFISVIISLLKYVPGLLAGRGGRRAERADEAADSAVQVLSAGPAATVDDGAADPAAAEELVAVISAAIAQAEGRDPSELVVRSLKRRPGNKWKN